jgi:VanZ family protein
MIDFKEFDFVAQNAHLCFGALMVFVPTYIFGPGALWYAMALFLVYALVKEFWYDERYETVEVRGSSLKDFLFYMLGAALGLVVYFGVPLLKHV